MKVLSLGLDNKVLDKHSEVAQRVLAYGELLDEYFVVVPARNELINLSDKVQVQGLQAGNKILTLFKIRAYLRKLLAKKKFDFMTIQDIYFLAALGLCLAKKFNLKSEIQVHGFEKLSGFRKMLAQSNFKKTDSIRVVSQRLKNYLVNNFKVVEHKIHIVPVAIDKDKIQNSQLQINLKEKYPNKFIFLTVARLVAVKNISLQIRALADLKNTQAKLIIVGDGPDKENLQSLVKDLKLSEQVEFIDWTDDLSSYYKTSDCFLLSSNSEGYGMVVAEAILADLPVIMTDVGCASELVANDLNGLIIAINDQKSFTKAMKRVIVDNQLLQTLSTNAQSFANQILSKRELVKKIVDHWQAIL